MTLHVPALSIVGMIFSLIVSFGLPIALFFYYWKCLGAKKMAVVYGFVTFVLFALALEQYFHKFVFSAYGDALTKNIIVYAIYGGLAAALFEEGGRFLNMKYYMKGQLTKEDALMFGVGHGGIEAITLIGGSYISNLATSLKINNGTIYEALASYDAETLATANSAMEQLCAVPSYQFFLAGVERIAAIAIQICFTYLIYRFVKEGDKSYLIIAVAGHATFDAIAVMLAQYVPVYFVELIILALAGLMVWYTRQLYYSEPY